MAIPQHPAGNSNFFLASSGFAAAGWTSNFRTADLGVTVSNGRLAEQRIVKVVLVGVKWMSQTPPSARAHLRMIQPPSPAETEETASSVGTPLNAGCSREPCVKTWSCTDCSDICKSLACSGPGRLTTSSVNSHSTNFGRCESSSPTTESMRDGDEDGRGGLSAMDPESAAVLLRDCGSWGREDAALTRLEQYRLLERKRDARQALERAHQPSYSSSGEDQTLLDAEFLKRRDDYRVSRRYISIFFLSPNLIFSRKKTGETYI